MVDGPAFRKGGAKGEFGIDELDIPYYIQIPKGCYVEHGRNAHIKDELYYYQHIKNPKDVNEVKTVCLRLTTKDIKKQMNASQIIIKNNTQKHDVWLHGDQITEMSPVIDIFQTISVQREDQAALLQTRVPSSSIANVPTEFKIIERRSS